MNTSIKVALLVVCGFLVALSGSFEATSAQKRPRLQVSGKWSWTQGSPYHGYFTIEQNGNSFTGTLDDVGEQTYRDDIVDGKIKGSVISFTRSGKYGTQYWRGAVIKTNDTLEIRRGFWRKEGQTEWSTFSAKKIE